MERYTLKTGHRSSHVLIREMIRRHHSSGGTIVDVGPWDGALFRSISPDIDFEKSVGLEVSTDNLDALRETFDEVAVTDLEHLSELPEASVIVLADVIEHTTRPSRLLSLARSALENDGHLFVSVPNIANIVTRLGLLAGRFDYQDKGILDRTHLRFFTRKTFVEALTENGFEVIELTVSSMPVRLVLDSRLPSILIRALEWALDLLTPLLPGLLGYQFVAVCKDAGPR